MLLILTSVRQELCRVDITTATATVATSGRPVVRVSASGPVDSGLISIRVKPTTLKLLFTAFLLDAQH